MPATRNLGGVGHGAKTILATIAAAAVYGVLHDEITIRICPEYFTVAHPPLFKTTSPTLLAICWGIAATMVIGAVLGAILAVVTTAGAQPAYALRRLVRDELWLLAFMGSSAALAGLAGGALARRGIISLPEAFAEMLPPAGQAGFMGVWCAHIASYATGMIGGAALVTRIWRRRGRPQGLAWWPAGRWARLRVAAVVVLAVLVFWLRFRR